MSKRQRFTEEFKLEAVKQVTERGFGVRALWKRKPTQMVTIHSDQGSQFSSYEWQAFLREHNLRPSMSRRGNCHDNAVVESFFQLLKREQVKRKTYNTRGEAREDILITLSCFTTRSGAIVTTMAYLR